jgi:hypothetical protein
VGFSAIKEGAHFCANGSKSKMHIFSEAIVCTFAAAVWILRYIFEEGVKYAIDTVMPGVSEYIIGFVPSFVAKRKVNSCK